MLQSVVSALRRCDRRVGVAFAEDLPDGRQIGHEVKVGIRKDPDEIVQCEKDAFLVASGQLAGVQWHFLPNARYNSLGPSEDLLNCLRTHGLPFTVHPPAA